MDISLDTLLVALFVALAPVEQDEPAPAAGTVASSVAQGREGLARPGEAGPVACRRFADPQARQNCVIRASRAESGIAAPRIDFPSQVTWLAPDDPGMPFRFAHGALR